MEIFKEETLSVVNLIKERAPQEKSTPSFTKTFTDYNAHRTIEPILLSLNISNIPFQPGYDTQS